MALRIAFDIDGVVADMEGELVRQAKQLFGEVAGTLGAAPSLQATDDDVPAQEPPAVESLNLTPRQQRKLWRHVESIENFWEQLEETEHGVIARLAALAADRRWETIFLTKRPRTAGATAQIQTQRWLQAKGYPLPSVYVVQGSRGRIAAALGVDIVVDDRPENCLDVVVDSKSRAILVWRADEQQLPPATRRLGIGVVGSTNACLDVLTQLEDANGADESIMSRVLRKLGLKESATA
jgi:hypothetical protein